MRWIRGGKHAGLQRGRPKEKRKRVGEPVGNLSSRRQTLLSKVREPKNLLEKAQLSGDKIGAGGVQCHVLIGQRAKGRSPLFHNFCLPRGKVAGLRIICSEGKV